MEKKILLQDRVRHITGSFGWVDRRLGRDGFIQQMTAPGCAIYLFLVVATNEYGVCWRTDEALCNTLGLSLEQISHARNRLVELGLIAFEPIPGNGVTVYYQVLPISARIFYLVKPWF